MNQTPTAQHLEESPEPPGSEDNTQEISRQGSSKVWQKITSLAPVEPDTHMTTIHQLTPAIHVPWEHPLHFDQHSPLQHGPHRTFLSSFSSKAPSIRNQTFQDPRQLQGVRRHTREPCLPRASKSSFIFLAQELTLVSASGSEKLKGNSPSTSLHPSPAS